MVSVPSELIPRAASRGEGLWSHVGFTPRPPGHEGQRSYRWNDEKYGEKHEHIPLHYFEIDMPVAELLTFCKELEITLLARDLQYLPFEVVSD